MLELADYLKTKGFELINQKDMWELFIIGFVKSAHRPFLRNIVTKDKATGVLGMIGNKGGVLLSFRLYST
jgi:hypothetical protein